MACWYFFSIQLLIREILFSRNLSFRVESSEIKILLNSAKKIFFCLRNHESFFLRNYLVTFFYFKVTKINLKRKVYQHRSKDNKPKWNYHNKICLRSDCFCFASKISKVWYLIEPFTKKKEIRQLLQIFTFFPVSTR